MREHAFATEDWNLAVVLATVGIPWLDPKAYCTNTYHEDDINSSGKTANQLRADGVPGKVIFYFKRVPELDRIVEDYRKIMSEKANVELSKFTAREVATIATFCMMNSETIGKAWQAAPPKVYIPRDDDGACTIIGAGTPAEVSEKWGL